MYLSIEKLISKYYHKKVILPVILQHYLLRRRTNMSTGNSQTMKRAYFAQNTLKKTKRVQIYNVQNCNFWFEN